MRVRLARAEDCAGLPDIERSAGRRFAEYGMVDVAEGEVAGPQHWEPFCVNETLWVAVDDADQPHAFLAAGDQGAALFIYEIAVRREDQGHGVGRALIAAAEAKARSLGLSQLVLTTFCSVPWNAPFYRRLGFETVADDADLPPPLRPVMEAERRRWTQPGRERCAMRKPL